MEKVFESSGMSPIAQNMTKLEIWYFKAYFNKLSERFRLNRKTTDIVFSQISKNGLTFKIHPVVSEYQIQTNV